MRSHAGEGPTLVPRMTAAWNRGQETVSSMAMAISPTFPVVAARRSGGTSSVSVPGMDGSRNGTLYDALSSRATPL